MRLFFRCINTEVEHEAEKKRLAIKAEIAVLKARREELLQPFAPNACQIALATVANFHGSFFAVEVPPLDKVTNAKVAHINSQIQELKAQLAAQLDTVAPSACV